MTIISTSMTTMAPTPMTINTTYNHYWLLSAGRCIHSQNNHQAKSRVK